MQTSTFFTEKPKTREDQIADEEDERLYHERLEDIEEDNGDEEDFAGMNDYYPNSEAW